MTLIKSKTIAFDPFLGLIAKKSFPYKSSDHYKRRFEPITRKKFQGIILITTTYCNLNCKYCYSKTFEKQDMPYEISKEFLETQINSGNKNLIIHFFGGEPTLRSGYIKDIVRFISNKSLESAYFHINTNGLVGEELLGFLIENKFKIIVSSDGSPDFDGAQRGGTAYWNKLEKTIDKLVENKTLFRVRCTITKDNINNLHNALNYWNDLGVEYIHFEGVNPFGLDLVGKGFIPDKKSYVPILKEIIEDAEERRMWIISSPFTNLLSPTKAFCTTCAGDYIVLTPDGTISSCLRVQGRNKGLGKFIIGDFSRESTKKYAEKIHSIKNIDVDKSPNCSQCHVRYICGGGCPMRNFLYTGGLSEPDLWECYVKKNLIEWGIERLSKYIQGDRFPSILGQHVFEKLVFANPTFGKPIFNIERQPSVNLAKTQKDYNFNDPHFIYSTVGTSANEFSSLSRLSRCECF